MVLGVVAIVTPITWLLVCASRDRVGHHRADFEPSNEPFSRGSLAPFSATFCSSLTYSVLNNSINSILHPQLELN